MESPEKFKAVFDAELGDIATRRGSKTADPKELAGLALSGGGIRSATSSLGALQALKKLGLLGAFDYLSTVSGGGFTGGWWSAWTSRAFGDGATASEKFFPPPERIQPERDAASVDAGVSYKRADPVHHLRLFSNYLTPVKGLMSSDTWRAITVISRNLGLTWVVLLPILFASVLAAQSYFTLQPDSETEYLYPYSHFNADKVLNEKIAGEVQLAKSLDSLVHGHNTSAIDPARELPAVSRIVTALDKNLDSIEIDEQTDRELSVGDPEHPKFQQLNVTLDTVVGRVQQWRSADSLRQISLYSGAFLAKTMWLRGLVDRGVDTVRTQLSSLQTALIRHRWETRDGWLFNATHMGYLSNRFIVASYPLIGLLGWVAMFIALWIINAGNKGRGGNVMQGSSAFVCGIIVFWSLLWVIPELAGHTEHPELKNPVFAIVSGVWGLIALVLLNRVLWDDAHWFWKSNRHAMTPERDQQYSKLLALRRSRIVLSHERLLLVTFVLGLLLAFGGFGHELINYMLFYNSGSTLNFWQWLTRALSLVALISALTGSSLLAKRATPSDTPGDRAAAPKESGFKKMLIAGAPVLILLVLLCSVSWTSHWVLQKIVFNATDPTNRDLITLVFLTWLLGGVSVYYAIQELKFRSGGRIIRRALEAYMVVAPASIVLSVLSQRPFDPVFGLVCVLVSAGAWGLIVWEYRKERGASMLSPNNWTITDLIPKNIKPSSVRIAAMVAIASLGMVGFSIMFLGVLDTVIESARLPFYWPYVAGGSMSIVVLLCDLAWGVKTPVDGFGGNHPARILLGINITLVTLFLFIPPLALDTHWGVVHVLAILIFIALGIVIFIGWRLDPNALSIHAFYRDRIVRAYLGASNWLRGHSSVSDVHPNDDVALTELGNCAQGAPYHIINTTLNMTGTKSLETAQRHASNFIMTKRFCGSVTTGYRPTADYMSGEMTLGTAVAISGAAASPNMGSNQVSAAATMLMSLLNIRLGYWAPNPGFSRWREASPRLWPYYLLKESMSATTGFGPYCYLTDGGHFDNTGLYPLIERACRYIVLCDNGADPSAHFKDIGNAFRRCRIDFGAEFTLDGLREMTVLATGRNRQHWLRGTVTYSDAHLRSIWGADWDKELDEEQAMHYRKGTILVLKPALIGDEPADVLQYGLESPDFPQQSTAEQWFSEDQFESYRRLGFWSAASAFSSSDYTGLDRDELLAAIAATREHPSTHGLREQLAYGPAHAIHSVDSPSS